MWANTAPDGGLIVVGLSDDGIIHGCANLPQQTINGIEKTGMVFCPDAIHKYKRVPVKNSAGADDFVMLFWVQYRQDRVVETCKGQAFIRCGDSKRALEPRRKASTRDREEANSP